MKKIFYRVQDGDSLSAISNRFNVPTFYVIKLNNLTAEVCSGDLLYLELLDRRTYTVGATDTLYPFRKSLIFRPKNFLKTTAFHTFFTVLPFTSKLDRA